MSKYEMLTYAQWTILELIIFAALMALSGRGRPPIHDNRFVMNGVL